MSWKVETKEYSDDELLELILHHRLVPQNPQEAVEACMSMRDATKYVIKNGSDEDVAKLFINVANSRCQASIDMIPTPSYFRSEKEYGKNFREAMEPILRSLFEIDGMRRITAWVPYSRGRTKKALRCLGFSSEGRIRDGVLFRRAKKGPEDLFVLGLTPDVFEKEYGNG